MYLKNDARVPSFVYVYMYSAGKRFLSLKLLGTPRITLVPH